MYRNCMRFGLSPAAKSQSSQGWLPGFETSKRDEHCSDQMAQPLTATRGLMVRDPYASQLLTGEKTWEIRGRATQIRGPIVIIKSGTGQAFGVVELVAVIGPLSLDDLVESTHLPSSEREEFRRTGLPYPKTFAYVVRNPRWFAAPISYRHPYGAVTWVDLSSLNPQEVRYAPVTCRQTQSAMD
jgi:hypothetical protein